MSDLIKIIKNEVNKVTGKKEEDKKDRYFYVTDIVKCRRQIYYQWTNADKTPYDISSLLRFDVGNAVHMILMRYLFQRRNIRVVSSEVDLPYEKCNGLIHGRADAIITIKGENELRVVDLKSIASYGFKRVKDGEEKEEYLLQVQLYMYFFDINKGSILYMNKDTSALFEQEVERDDKKIEKLVEEFIQLKEKLDRGEKPDRRKIKDWHCDWCPYKNICLEKTVK